MAPLQAAGLLPTTETVLTSAAEKKESSEMELSSSSVRSRNDPSVSGSIKVFSGCGKEAACVGGYRPPVLRATVLSLPPARPPKNAVTTSSPGVWREIKAWKGSCQLTQIQQHAVRGKRRPKLFLEVVGSVQEGLQLLSKLPFLGLLLEHTQMAHLISQLAGID